MMSIQAHSLRLRPWLLAATLLASGQLAAWSARPPVTLHLDSQPQGAAVYQGRHYLGQTPCDLTVKPGRRPLRLQLPGHVPAFQFALPDRETRQWVLLRPGQAGRPDVPPPLLPGFYPPQLGPPPGSRRAPRDESRFGHPIAVPPQWTLRENRLTCGTRTADLAAPGSGSQEERLAAARERYQREGWTCVWSRTGGRVAQLRLERSRGLGQDRACLLMGALDVLYLYPDCPDAHNYVRDLDFLTGYLDL